MSHTTMKRWTYASGSVHGSQIGILERAIALGTLTLEIIEAKAMLV
jgi:hypothetical protein